MLDRCLPSLLIVSLLAFCGMAQSAEPVVAKKVGFQKIQLDDKFRSEGVAVGDYNRDGKLDVAAGFVWYEAPNWQMHVIASEPPAANDALRGTPPHFDPKGYANSFCNFADDLNGDGWTDLIVMDFPGTPTWWFENPRDPGKPWPRHLCTPVTNNESPLFVDVDGDGKRDIVAGFAPDSQTTDGPDRQVGFMTRNADPLQAWRICAISVKEAPGARRYSHGLGVGDVNGDRRQDVLCADGWWAAPAADGQEPWQFHAAAFGERPATGEGKAAHLCMQDFDGDGDQDVLASSPHAFGIWWHEQAANGEWVAHEVDNSFSQTHAVCLVDLNDDGLTDFVTGKRWWAHAKGDPGGDQPAVMAWFEQSRAGGKTTWTKHEFDTNSGVGTQFEINDINGDSLPDVITSNKKGVYVFLHVRSE
jgi:hypothetical protein